MVVCSLYWLAVNFGPDVLQEDAKVRVVWRDIAQRSPGKLTHPPRVKSTGFTPKLG